MPGSRVPSRLRLGPLSTSTYRASGWSSIDRSPITSLQNWIDLRNPTQLDDLVSQQGRLFELECARGRLHLALELYDHAVHLFAGNLGDDAALAARSVSSFVFSHGADSVCQVLDFLDNAAGHDSVLIVVLELEGATPVRLVDRRAHRAGHVVRVHDDQSVDVSGRSPNRLNQ